MTELIREAITPVLGSIISIIVSVIGVSCIGLLNKAKAWIVAKVGSETYNRAREVAIGLYTLLEDEFDGIVGAGMDKKAKMEKLLLEQFPTLTQTELDAINKDVCATIKTQLETSKILNAAG